MAVYCTIQRPVITSQSINLVSVHKCKATDEVRKHTKNKPMAKLTNEQAGAKLKEIKATIEQFSALNLPVPAFITEEYERLTKSLEGNQSSKVYDFFNKHIAANINGNAEFLQAVLEQIEGDAVTLRLAKHTAEDGTVTVQFAKKPVGQKAGTSTNDGTKAATPFSGYKVTVVSEIAGCEYKEKEGSFESAKKAVEFILNGGKNPFNLAADYGAGNSMVRVLVGLNGKGGISGREDFKQYFKLELITETAKAAQPTAPVTEATEDVPTAPAAE
jgi:hypothetical protein